MKKIILIISMILFLTPVYAKEFDISSKNVIMYNMNDNTIIYQKDAKERVQIASLTKIMTTIVAIENIDDLNSNVTMSKQAYLNLEDYAESGLKAGNVVTYNDLLYATMLPSGADAAQQLALSISDSIDSFVELMNKKAKDLKLKDTKFSNVIGKDNKNNYSTAYDLSVLLKYCLKNDTFKKVFTTKHYKIESQNLAFSSTLKTYSKKYGIDTSYIKGAKTGYTEGAKVCLASIATIDDVNYLLIVLGSDYKTFFASHIKDSIYLYNYFSSNYSYRNIATKGDVITTLPVKLSNTKTVDLVFDKDIKMYLKDSIDLSSIEYKYTGVDVIKRSNYDKLLGTVDVVFNNKVLSTTDVYLNQKLKFNDIKLIVIGSILLLIVVLIIIKIKKKNDKFSFLDEY